MSTLPSQRRQRHAAAIRIVIGCVVGIAIVAALLRVRSEAHDAGGVLSTMRDANRSLLAAAIVLEAGSYVAPALILRRLIPELGFGYAQRVALASLGVGPLVPGNPASGTGIGYAELRRVRVTTGRAATASFALVIGIPAASMAMLAGPTLIGSGLATSLPDGWKGVVLVAGALALVLAAGTATVLVRGTRDDRAGRAVAALGGSPNAMLLLALGCLAWLCDAGCLWLTGVALHTRLPLAALPMAYVAAVAIGALPVLPGGLGAVEVTLPAIFAAGGSSYAASAVVVLAWRLLSFWLPTLAGLASLLWLHRSRSPLAVHPAGSQAGRSVGSGDCG
jgi:uncharacterized membrane protein YbhN (UPF0104 family)